MRTCYYILLEVEHSASAADLKKAYRKRALICHPDKNPGNIEEATQHFALIQEAYEVLSDPQERSWYDSHREQILRGDDDGAGDTGKPGGLYAGHGPEDIMAYFSSAKYSGFGQDEKSFYTVYRNLFADLAQEELDAAEVDDLVEGVEGGLAEFYAMGSFGSADTPFIPWGNSDEERIRSPREFYARWIGFATRKSFRWMDKWKLSDAGSRYEKRFLEKENKKARDAGRRAYNDAIRSLAAFVRKRDPRYKKYQQDQAEKLKTAAIDRRQRVAEHRETQRAKADAYEAPSWAQVDLGRRAEEMLEDLEIEEERWECAACGKSFKTEKQWVNHEGSAKHRKAIRALRRQLLREEGLPSEPESEEEDPDEEALSSVLPSGDDEGAEEDIPDIPDIPIDMRSRKERKAEEKRRKQMEWQAKQSALASEEEDEEDEEEKEEGLSEAEETGPTLAPSIPSSILSSAQNSPSEVEEKPSSRRRAKKGKAQPKPLVVPLQSTDPSGWDSEDDASRPKGRRGKKPKGPPTYPDPSTAEFACNVCNSEYPTRNQLFSHIKATGHAVHIEGKKKASKKR